MGRCSSKTPTHAFGCSTAPELSIVNFVHRTLGRTVLRRDPPTGDGASSNHCKKAALKENDCKKTKAQRNPCVNELDEPFARTADSSTSDASPLRSDHREVQVLSRSKDFRKDTVGVEKSPKRGGCRDYEPPFKYLPVRKRSVLPKRFGDEKLARQSEEDVATNAVESSAVVGDPASEPAADADEPETWNLVSTSLVTDTDTSSWKNIVPISAATSVEDEQYSPPKYSISDPSDTGEIEEEEYDE
ncbi:unnamed protein product [Cercospora beticola]|nr:unnamed protein product [Cercospora beticola]